MMDESITDCPKCESENTLVRLLNKPYIEKKTSTKNPNSVGEVTKKFIEENREILSQQKKEIKEKIYDKS
tara:strand:+ start:101 stop:310 length:210 start_codon:yes stop_codon:yes gene_type:complete